MFYFLTKLQMFYFLTKRLRLFLAAICRPVYCILFGRKTDNWLYMRSICSYFCGILFALLIWQFIVMNFSLSAETELLILIALFAIIGLGFVFTTCIKCVTLLVFVAIVGKSGRSYLRALSFAFVIAGPIDNLSANSEEIVRVFACSTVLTYNLTRTRFDLMTKPFQNTFTHMKGDIREVQHAFAEVQGVLKPIHNEVEGEDPPENVSKTSRVNHRRDVAARRKPELIQNKYKEKFKKRCQRQLAKGEDRCRQAFSKAREECRVKFPRIVKSLLCWPFRADFVCNMNLLLDPDEVCDPSDAIPSDFGENYVSLDMAEQELVQNASNVEVEYKLHKNTIPTALLNSKETAEEIMKEFNTRKHVFDYIMAIMQRVLSILFIRVFYASVIYHYKYRKQIDFDNLYITDYFKHVDQRQSSTGKRTILPLKKYEKRNVIDLAHPCSRTKDEYKAIWFHLMQFCLEIITGVFFLLLDYLIVSLLTIVRMRSEISYVQQGEHRIHFHIEGSGLMARLLRSTLRNFNMHERVSTFLTNEACLPKPHVLAQSFYIKLLALYLIILFLIYKSTTFLRMRRLICGYFYRSREKQRILFLYNSLLQQRRSIFETMLKNAQANIAKRQIRRQLNLLLKLRLKFPELCDWLRCFKIARRKCLICDGLEDDQFLICSNENCGFAYCQECLRDIGTKCLVCNQTIKIIQIINFNEFFESLTNV